MKLLSLLRAGLAIGLAVGLVGCATETGVKPGLPGKLLTPEEAVSARAQQRWDALVAGEMEKAYGFLTTAGRLAMPLNTYRLRINSQYWRKVKVKEAACEPELCVVKVDFDYQINSLPLSQVLTEKWILEDGKWFFVYQG